MIKGSEYRVFTKLEPNTYEEPEPLKRWVWFSDLKILLDFMIIYGILDKIKTKMHWGLN